MSRRLKAGALWRGLGQDSPEPHPLGAQAWGLRRAPLSRTDKRLGRTPFAQQRLRLRPLWLVNYLVSHSWFPQHSRRFAFPHL